MQRTTGSASRASRSRLLLHRLAGIGGWLAFLFLAWWQFPAEAPRDWPLVALGLFLLLVLFELSLAAWVWWNRRIYRRRYRRLESPAISVDASRDALGRAVAMEVPGNAIAVRVIREGRAKHYVAEAAGVLLEPARGLGGGNG